MEDQEKKAEIKIELGKKPEGEKEYSVYKCEDGMYRVAYTEEYDTEAEAIEAMEEMGLEDTSNPLEDEDEEEEEVRGKEALEPKLKKYKKLDKKEIEL